MSLPLSKLNPLVKESFVTTEDNVEIFPTFGRKRSKKLMRTKLSIELKSGNEFKIGDDYIILPSLSNSESCYQLTLDEFPEVSVYNLKLLSGDAFKINGKFCKEAYLQHYDEVLIGHNKLYFPGPTSKLEKSNNIELSTDVSLLIEGETGTGKSTLARELHVNSDRNGEFVHINIASFPASLIESELFGHVKGAFTGAVSNKEGALQVANGGTLFLDEIDSLTPELQVKLLTFLDNKRFRQVGSMIEKVSDTAIIFASGKPLEQVVQDGGMRKDFYFRVTCGLSIMIKPLREDPSKMDKIIENFQFERNIFISTALKTFLKSLQWPGNIRQLKGHLEKKRILSKSRNIKLDEIDYSLLSLGIVEENSSALIIPFRQIKHSYYKRAYYMCDGNVDLAARKLEISVNSLKKNLQDE